MSAALAITPASGSIVAKSTACRVNVTGADVSDMSLYDAEVYPTAPGIRYYLSFEKSGSDSGKSQVFEVAADGSFEFNSYIFPSDGSWTLHLRKASDNSSVVSIGVTVS